jgi:hypothetical protein
MQTPRYEPLQRLLKASPETGTDRYDFIRGLLKSTAAAPKDDPKWDLVGEVLRYGREEAQSQDDEGAPRRPPPRVTDM